MEEYNIYTDGSHIKGANSSGRLGIGAVLVKLDGSGLGTKIKDFGIPVGKDLLMKNVKTIEVSNPTMELLAVYFALMKFGVPENSKVHVYADYIGVKEWMEGNWKAKADYIATIKYAIERVIKRRRIKVDFNWVKGHQQVSTLNRDAYWNNYVDKLAREGSEKNPEDYV